MPSLNALRAFEAMARTGRVTLAAEELHVTPVSYTHLTLPTNREV